MTSRMNWCLNHTEYLVQHLHSPNVYRDFQRKEHGIFAVILHREVCFCQIFLQQNHEILVAFCVSWKLLIEMAPVIFSGASHHFHTRFHPLYSKLAKFRSKLLHLPSWLEPGNLAKESNPIHFMSLEVHECKTWVLQDQR